MARKIIKNNDKVLDLGCGSGVVGCYLYKKKIIKYIYGSDISEAAVNCSIYNAKKLTNDYDIRLSNSLSNWKNRKFDFRHTLRKDKILQIPLKTILTLINSPPTHINYSP